MFFLPFGVVSRSKTTSTVRDRTKSEKMGTIMSNNMPTTASTCVLALALALAGCDAQASPAYKGEALLTISGSVEIVSQRERGELLPALAFLSKSSLLHIMDVEVEGEFPSDFTLRVYEPPPKEATAETEGGTEMAYGHITAVTPDHPDTIPYSLRGESGGWCTGEAGGAIEYCETVESWCNASGCYEETRACPAIDSPPEDCEIISSSGDPSLRQDYWAAFAGLSEEHMVVYLVEPLAQGDSLARFLGVERLEAGYYLVRMPAMTQAERLTAEEAAEPCQREARVLALQRYNDAYGTNFAVSELSAGSPLCAPGQDCPEPLPPDVYAEFHQLFQQAEDELECLADLMPQLVENPENERISVRIAADVQPAGF